MPGLQALARGAGRVGGPPKGTRAFSAGKVSAPRQAASQQLQRCRATTAGGTAHTLWTQQQRERLTAS